MRFYTWKDIERYCLIKRSEWKNEIFSMDVYPDELIVYKKDGITDEKAKDILLNIFPKNMNIENDTISLDREAEPIAISFDKKSDSFEKNTMPLFEQVIYKESVYPQEKLGDLPCPVIAFHSYKGGVGCTLSLLAFAQAWTNIRKEADQEKILIIDSDIESPGLSLIQGDKIENEK
ncbi:MAG: hypothetical protein KHZ91_01330 [Firmicutes bacterium]|nr:hypothetical protein [Bacillota bacterium]